MTTYFDFVPPPQRRFEFQPELDGDLYQARVSWGLFGQRWYLDLFTLEGERLLTVALAGSPDAMKTSRIWWKGAAARATVETTTRHFVPVGTVAMLYLSGVLPDAYNGLHLMYAISDTRLEFDMQEDPDPASVDDCSPAVMQGNLAADIDLVQGYFVGSRLVYRASTRQFEVTP